MHIKVSKCRTRYFLHIWMLNSERNRFPFTLTLKGIWSYWQVSYWLCTKLNSVLLMIKVKLYSVRTKPDWTRFKFWRPSFQTIQPIKTLIWLNVHILSIMEPFIPRSEIKLSLRGHISLCVAHSLKKTSAIKRIAVRETSVSRHNWDPIGGPSETR